MQAEGRALHVKPSRIEEMVRQGRHMEVAEALMEHIIVTIPNPLCKSSSTSLISALLVPVINWRPTLPKQKRPTLLMPRRAGRRQKVTSWTRPHPLWSAATWCLTAWQASPLPRHGLILRRPIQPKQSLTGLILRRPIKPKRSSNCLVFCRSIQSKRSSTSSHSPWMRILHSPWLKLFCPSLK
jgi:hypothetical protein